MESDDESIDIDDSNRLEQNIAIEKLSSNSNLNFISSNNIKRPDGPPPTNQLPPFLMSHPSFRRPLTINNISTSNLDNNESKRILKLDNTIELPDKSLLPSPSMTGLTTIPQIDISPKKGFRRMSASPTKSDLKYTADQSLDKPVIPIKKSAWESPRPDISISIENSELPQLQISDLNIPTLRSTSNNNNDDDNKQKNLQSFSVASSTDFKTVTCEPLTQNNSNTVSLEDFPSAQELELNMNIIRTLKGRLSIKCIDGSDIRPLQHSIPDLHGTPIGYSATQGRIDPFIKFRLVEASSFREQSINIVSDSDWKKTMVKRKQGRNPNFNKELIQFLIPDMSQYVCQEVVLNVKNKNEKNNTLENILLEIQLWNSSTLQDIFIGQSFISILPFIVSPYSTTTQTISMKYPYTGESNGKLRLEILFEHIIPGMITLSLFKADNLRINDERSSFAMCAECSLGPEYKLRFKPAKLDRNSFVYEPYNKSGLLEDLDVVFDLHRNNSWMYPLIIRVVDISTNDEDVIGETKIDIFSFTNPKQKSFEKEEYDLTVYNHFVDKTLSAGTISLLAQFLQAGKLTCLVDYGKSVLLPPDLTLVKDSFLSIDVYLKITIAGQSKTVVKTSQITKFGPSPIWNEEFVFDIVDECIIQIEMYAQTTYDHSEEIYQHEKEPDKLIGTNNYSLLQVFKNGIESAWLPLKLPKPGGKSMRETGKIYMTSSFNGPTGVSFPQHRSNIITYDDKYRRSQTDIRSSHKSRSEEHGESDNIMEDQSVELEAAPSTIVGNKEKVIHKDIQKSVQNKHEELQRALSFESEDKYAPKDTVSEGSHRDQTEQEVLPKEIPDFTDEEIVAAFRFIDLDHNNYVGAKEIRHVLICMGELITDEEVDMMISLVDTDGDGQISLEEFRALVLSKNIENNNDYDEGIQHRAKSMKQFSTKSLQDVDHIKIKSESLSSEDKIVLTLEDLAQQRQKEMKLRDDKKRHLITFVAENDVSYERVKMYYQLFTELPLLDRPHNCVNYDNFLSCLMIESMSEYEKLFRLFLPEFTASSHRRDDESIDFRQFLLSLMNFVSIPREQRIKFSFIMYDENRTGVITQVELEDILRGNHMTNLISVKRKAETVMKQISKDGMNGSITMNELIIISKKFPNILIPTIQNRS